MPALSRVGPALQRNATDSPPPPAAPAAATTAGPALKLPSGMSVVTDDPGGIGTNELVVEVASFTLPKEKGLGDWVQKAHDARAGGSGLVFTPLFDGNSVAAWKEGSEDYKSIWLGNHGFATTQALSLAFRSAAKTDQDVKSAYADSGGEEGGGRAGQRPADRRLRHRPYRREADRRNLDPLEPAASRQRQESGLRPRDLSKTRATRGRDPRPVDARPGVRKLQLRLKQVTVPPGTTDGSFVVERLLRDGKVKGSDAVKTAAGGTPVSLSAGGMSETVQATDKGDTPVGAMAKRLVPGVRLVTYKRSPHGPKGKTDVVRGELDSRALNKSAAASVVEQVSIAVLFGFGLRSGVEAHDLALAACGPCRPRGQP